MRGKREELDRLDSELIVEAVQTPGYKLIAARIDQEAVKVNRSLVEAATDLAEIYRAQGTIRGLRLALSIPKILADEAQDKKKHGRS